MSLFIIALAVFASLIVSKHQRGITELKQQINPSLQRALDEELEIRFARSNDYFAFIKPPNSTDNKEITIESKNKIDTLKEDRTLLLYGNFEQLSKQFYLEEGETHKLSADSLNYYFNKSLQMVGIKIPTYVKINNLFNQQKSESTTQLDKSVFTYYSDSLVIDLRRQIQVQAFCNFPLLVVLSYGKWSISDSIKSGILLFLILIIAFISYQNYQQKKRRKPQIIQLGSLIFHVERRKIQAGQQEIEVRAQLSRLIELFIAAPDHLLTKEEIKANFWPNNTYQTDSKIHNLIASLRQLCKIDPSIRIEIIPQKGYQLRW